MSLARRPVPADFRLLADRKPPCPGPELLDRIAWLWREATLARPGLFDGRTYCACELTPGGVHGFLAPYSWRLAARRDPEVRRALGLRPLDVSCLSLCAGLVVLGRRSPALAVDGGLWELCPSGVVDGSLRLADAGLDFLGHAAQESREELGLAPARPGRAFTLVENTDTGVWDLGIALDLPGSPEELLRRHRTLGDGEYEELALLPLDEASALAEALGGAGLAPVSRELLAAFANLPED